MDKFAVVVMPVARTDEWLEFCESAEHGERAEAHRSFLRRIGITREHIFHQPTPMGDFAVLVWEGVDPAEVGERMGQLVQDPQSDHERYIGSHVIPVLHGVDPTAGPPPETRKVATMEA